MKSKAHNLKDLLYGIKDAPPIKYNNICDDSRCVNKGTVFFAVKGLSSDGCDYIESAINSGACAVVYEPPYDLSNIETSIPIIAVETSASIRLRPFSENFFIFIGCSNLLFLCSIYI